LPKYSIRKNRINSAYITGIGVLEDGKLKFDPESMFHGIFFRAFDSGVDEAEWGRLSLKVEKTPDVVLSIYITAVNFTDMASLDFSGTVDDYLLREDIDMANKIGLLKTMGAKRFMETDDLLLYDFKGRYLYLAIELQGEGEAVLSDIVIDALGDNFMGAFPEIYQERNSFFHRYMSVFSSIYNDFQIEIDNFPEILNLDTCPKEMLITYGGWMGIDLEGGFLPEDILRNLVKEAYSLNRMKGTKKAIERILEIVLGEKAVIIEHNMLSSLKREEAIEMLPGLELKGPFDVTVLVRSKLTEETRSRLEFILNQFKPVRCNIGIAQMDENVIIDSSSYLDVNAKIPEEHGAVLDANESLSGMIILQ